ncbi:MAG: oligosaccharide flippase family protein [Anaerolineales bacterium]
MTDLDKQADKPLALPAKFPYSIADKLPNFARKIALLFMGQGAREGYLAAMDQGLISVANFLATLILARLVSPTELGVYGVGFTSLRLVRSVQEGLTIQPMNTIGAALDGESFKRYATSTSLIQLGMAVASAAAVALGGWVLTALGNDTAGPALFSLWFVFLFWQLQEYIRRILYTRGHVFQAALNTALANTVRIGILIVLANRNLLSGAAGLNAIAWGSLAALLPGLWQTRTYWTPRFANLAETWKKNWNFGSWLLGGTLSNWVAVEFYPVLTAGMISFAAAGAYRALQNPILAILSLAVLFPEPILRLLYGETYLAYSGGITLMALFYMLWFAYWPIQIAFKAARSSRPIFLANLAASGAMFTLGIWMISRWGVYGTIAGQALNALVVGLFLWGTWLRTMKRKPA